jgi:hypothetical protein
VVEEAASKNLTLHIKVDYPPNMSRIRLDALFQTDEKVCVIGWSLVLSKHDVVWQAFRNQPHPPKPEHPK